MKIQTLESQVIDQIAAGEVVERPAHLVKELIENSLDAKATKIELDFSEGGKRVVVTDNGEGMAQEDLVKAFDRHATSKISQASDLWKLETFGFRGEALASIAAVSEINITSKQSTAEVGTRLKLNFGIKQEPAAVSAENGTQFQMSQLFENFPARKKFLKSDGAEVQQIRQVIKALALSNPKVEFRWMENRELMGFWPAVSTRLERAEQIFEMSPLYAGDYQKGPYKVHAVMASPEIVSKTSKNIWIFAQNRWIQDRSLQAACLEAYRNLLMHGEFPTCCVWVESDPAEIDVNVHPTKSQVKFSNNGDVFRAVFHAIRDQLEKGPWLHREPVTTPIYSQDTSPVQQQTWVSPEFDQIQYQTKSAQPQNSIEDRSAHNYSSQNVKLNSSANVDLISETKIEATPLGPWSRLQVLGQAAQTYLICQSQDGLTLIDQHAAHERVAFEKLMTAWKGGRSLEIQNFLFPLSVDLSEAQVEVLESEIEQLKRIGIQLEILGPKTVGVMAAPIFLKEKALAQSLDDLSRDMIEQGPSFVFEKKISDLFASMACHSVVRAGQALSLQQMRELLIQMDEFPLSSFCPHGRPVSIEMSFAKLEKDFGRKL